MKKTIIIKVNGDQDSPDVSSIRRQFVSNLKANYNIIFLPEEVELSDVGVKMLDGSESPIEMHDE